MYNFGKIAIIGKSGVGKTEMSQYLNEKYGYEMCNTGKRVRELAKEFFEDESKDILHKIDDSFNSIERGIWLKIALRNIDNSSVNIVIDSLRFLEDYDFVKKNDYSIWKIECDKAIRLKRLRKRHQAFNMDDLDHISEMELDKIIPDVSIRNEGNNILDLYSAIDAKLR